MVNWLFETLAAAGARRFLAGAVVLAVSLSLVAAPAGAQSGQPVKIGLVTPITGDIAPLGQALLQGVELGVEVVNERGGIAGRPVQLIVEDEQGNPAVAAERAKKLVEGDQVDILMGTITSASTLAVLPVVNQNKIPFFYVIEGEDKACLPGNMAETNPYVFGNGYTPEMMWNAVTDKMMEHGKRWYFIGSDYVFPRTMNAVGVEAVRSRGGEIIGDEYLPLGTTEFSTTIARIERAGPDVLWNTLVAGDAIAFAKQADQFGLFDQFTVAGSAGFATELYLGLRGSVENRILAVDRYTDVLDNPENQEFVRRFREKFNVPADVPIGPVAAGGGYGTLIALKAAGDKAGSVEPEALRQALEGLRVQLPQGEVEIDADNHIFNMHLYLMNVTPAGKYEVVQDLGRESHPGHVGCVIE